MRAQAGLTAPDSQPRPILPQKPASDYQIHYIIRVLLLQNLPLNIQLEKVILPPGTGFFKICLQNFSEFFHQNLVGTFF